MFSFFVKRDSAAPQSFKDSTGLSRKNQLLIRLKFAPWRMSSLAIFSECSVVPGLEKFSVSVIKPVKSERAMFLVISMLFWRKKKCRTSAVEDAVGITKLWRPNFLLLM